MTRARSATGGTGSGSSLVKARSRRPEQSAEVVAAAGGLRRGRSRPRIWLSPVRVRSPTLQDWRCQQMPQDGQAPRKLGVLSFLDPPSLLVAEGSANRASYLLGHGLLHGVAQARVQHQPWCIPNPQFPRSALPSWAALLRQNLWLTITLRFFNINTAGGDASQAQPMPLHKPDGPGRYRAPNSVAKRDGVFFAAGNPSEPGRLAFFYPCTPSRSMRFRISSLPALLPQPPCAPAGCGDAPRGLLVILKTLPGMDVRETCRATRMFPWTLFQYTACEGLTGTGVVSHDTR